MNINFLNKNSKCIMRVSNPGILTNASGIYEIPGEPGNERVGERIPPDAKSSKPEKILEYLSRYVFCIAITDRRIIKVKDGKVHFSWKDYRRGHFRIKSQLSLHLDHNYTKKEAKG